MKFEQHIDITATDCKAVDILQQGTDLSKQLIKQAMSKGAVWLARDSSVQRVRRADKVLKPGDILHLYYDTGVLDKQPQDAVLVADEGSYSIWYKPYGMLSQGSKWGDHCTINRWVEKHLQPQRPAFIVHRLDRAATGLMIIAHQKKIAAYFSKLFERREIEKKYQAIVHGEFPDYQKIDSAIEGKPSVSHMTCLKYDHVLDQSLLDVSIETGRKHQIRRHLAEAGFPIVGDRLYGAVEDQSDRDLCLTSCYLSFISPLDDARKSYTLPAGLLNQDGG
jgi:tRNA pseudouridine32 synthase/23S rRNA pseudouridine746 synthase